MHHVKMVVWLLALATLSDPIIWPIYIIYQYTLDPSLIKKLSSTIDIYINCVYELLSLISFNYLAMYLVTVRIVIDCIFCIGYLFL